jgi:general secretion pathway protein G
MLSGTNKIAVGAAVVVIAFLIGGFVYLRTAPGIVDTKQAQAKQQLMVVKAALEKYRVDNGRYPSQEEGLRALIDPSLKTTYLANEFALKDPWGRLIVYRLTTAPNDYLLYSLGPTGIAGSYSSIQTKVRRSFRSFYS